MSVHIQNMDGRHIPDGDVNFLVVSITRLWIRCWRSIICDVRIRKIMNFMGASTDCLFFLPMLFVLIQIFYSACHNYFVYWQVNKKQKMIMLSPTRKQRDDYIESHIQSKGPPGDVEIMYMGRPSSERHPAKEDFDASVSHLVADKLKNLTTKIEAMGKELESYIGKH